MLINGIFLHITRYNTRSSSEETIYVYLTYLNFSIIITIGKPLSCKLDNAKSFKIINILELLDLIEALCQRNKRITNFKGHLKHSEYSVQQ